MTASSMAVPVSMKMIKSPLAFSWTLNANLVQCELAFSWPRLIYTVEHALLLIVTNFKDLAGVHM
jgi:hypothetical protein